MVQASVVGVLLVISMAAASDGVEADGWEEFILNEQTITLIESELAEAFGGLWLNEEPGRPRVMVGVAGGDADRAVARVQAHLGDDGRDLAFVPVDYSWQELREYQDHVSHLVSSVSLVDSSLVSIDSRANRVRVELSRRDSSKVLPVLEVLPDDVVHVDVINQPIVARALATSRFGRGQEVALAIAVMIAAGVGWVRWMSSERTG